jgi:hypothetical protein
LAEFFCADAGIESKLIVTELAAEIQQTIEDFLDKETKVCPDEV